MAKLPLLKSLILILLSSSLLLNFFLLKKVKENQPGEMVLEVLDGDTVLLEQDVRLRLRHIDAPELQFCGGQQAKDLLTELVKGKKVVIKEQILDQYGRPMALLYTNNVLVNLEMIKSGWVRYHSDNTSQEKTIKDMADRVKDKSIGIFSPLCYQTKNETNPRCNIKGNIDKNSTKRNYYYPGCAQYEFTIIEKDLGEGWFCTEKEAQEQGFTKAETCKMIN